MALVAKMKATLVSQNGGGTWVACNADEEGAKPVGEAGVGSMYGIPPWLDTTGYVKWLSQAQSGESIKLTCVSAKGEDDPNREWAAASPSGNLDMHIQNPGAFGYVQAGAEYRITIERIRGPRNAERQALADAAEQDARRGTS